MDDTSSRPGPEPARHPTGYLGGGTVLLTDYAWPDTEIEKRIIEDAGLRLVAGPSVAGTPEAILRLVEAHDPVAILTCWAPVSAQAVNRPSALRIVARLGVGLDNIDIAAATARGAWVTNVPDYCVEEVSDHAIALLLGHFRGIVRHDRTVKAGSWNQTSPEIERFRDLTIGLIGLGRIGRATARKLAGFGCRILAVDPLLTAPPEGVETGHLDELRQRADAIVLHLPHTPQTQHLVDDAFIGACKRRPLLVNVSRGGLVDNDALVRGLESGALRGAALDVVEGEPSPPAWVVGRPDVIATPHVGFLSKASVADLRRRACEEVVRVLRGEPPRHPCNEPDVGVPLPGGVSSDIRVVSAAEGGVVIKTALAKLTVEADWFSDPARSSTEVAALRAMAELVGADAVPRVLWSDPARHRFAMQRIDPKLRNWKQDLMAGKVDLATAARVGELLGQLHGRSAARPELSERFADVTYFQQLRVQPYLRRIAERNSGLAPAIGGVIEGLTTRRQALVHGDYSPKNILADGPRVVVLDCEVAHWGDPRFDIGFVLSHLLLKALRRGADAQALAAAGNTLLEAYRREGLPVLDLELVRVTGCLVLARLEGDSLVDYLDEIDRDIAKRLAVALISGQPIAPETIMQLAAKGP